METTFDYNSVLLNASASNPHLIGSLDTKARLQMREVSRDWNKEVDRRWGDIAQQIGFPKEVIVDSMAKFHTLFSNMQTVLSHTRFFSKVKLPMNVDSAKRLYQYLTMRANASLLEAIVEKANVHCCKLKGIKQKGLAIWKCKQPEEYAQAIFSGAWEKSANTIQLKLVATVSQQEIVKRVIDLDLRRKAMPILPLQLFQLTNLVSLNLFHNDLLFMPNQILLLTNLKKLNVKNNFIENLPEGLPKTEEYTFMDEGLFSEEEYLETDSEESYEL
jgi:hypothetical protein